MEFLNYSSNAKILSNLQNVISNTMEMGCWTFKLNFFPKFQDFYNFNSNVNLMLNSSDSSLSYNLNDNLTLLDNVL
jgi:hypothetical protein